MNQTPIRPPQKRMPLKQPARRPPQKKKLRPGAVFVICLVALLVLALIFVITYSITRAALQKQPEQSSTPDASQTSSESTQQEEEKSETVTPVSEKPKPSPAVTFSSLDDIVSYVDNLGINFADLASFSMDPYFQDVTLSKTADAGEAYVNETVYIGDSLVLHMTSRSKLPQNMVYGAASINPEDACTKDLTALANGTPATFAEAMKEKQPKRIVINIGTNSMWMEPYNYLYFFSRFIDQLKESCPSAELILHSTPPLTAAYEAGKNFPTNAKINRFNLYLAGLASFRGIWFLNSAAALKGPDGTLAAEYDNQDGFHITQSAYDVWLDFLRTHATTLQ